ncbi:MAG: hypothetical protein U0W40_16080 [Acidimicrobiia bacterium]
MQGVDHQFGDGLPHADAIMERGFILLLNHALQDEHIQFVIDTLDAFLAASPSSPVAGWDRSTESVRPGGWSG